MIEIQWKLILKDQFLVFCIIVDFDASQRDSTHLTLDNKLKTAHELSVRPSVPSYRRLVSLSHVEPHFLERSRQYRHVIIHGLINEESLFMVINEPNCLGLDCALGVKCVADTLIL